MKKIEPYTKEHADIVLIEALILLGVLILAELAWGSIFIPM